jgi:2',3'-cyclic-nucleotide 2'-phosphodiesterase (5'-nucleotidase family)
MAHSRTFVTIPKTHGVLPALVLVGALVLSCAPPAEERAPTPTPHTEPLRLQVLHTNDFHGRLLPQVVDGDTVGGAALVAAHLDSLRARFEGPTIVLSGGDIMQGTAVSNLSWGRPSIEVHNLKGFDAAALGNHEFDWGIDTLRARIAESEFPWLGANVYVEGTRTHPDWTRPHLVLERDGVRVGIIGVALATTPEVVMAGRTEGLEFGDEAEAIEREARALRAMDVDFLVVTGHVGATCQEAGQLPTEPSSGCESRAVEILESLNEPVDLFVGGHTHLRNLTEVAGVPLLQSPAYTLGISVGRLERTGSAEVRPTHLAIVPPRADSADPDTLVSRVVADWVRDVEPLLAEPVVRLAQPLSNEQRQPVENPAGNLLADAQRWATGADVGLVNNGSLRRGLPAGEVSWGVLYEFQPFQNELVVVEVDGELLRRVLEFGLTEDGRPWTHLSGLRVRYDPSAPQGGRIVQIHREDGTEVRPADTLRIGTTEFLATGGDGYQVLTEGRLQSTGLVDVDGLVEYLREGPDPFPAPELGRWQQVTDGNRG